MESRFTVDFEYDDEPRVSLTLYSPETEVRFSIEAHIDTGAEITMFDDSIARQLRLDLTHASEVHLVGLGGRTTGRLAEVELTLLGSVELTIALSAAFVSDDTGQIGNLIGLDVLSSFSLGLAHGQRHGFLGVPVGGARR